MQKFDGVVVVGAGPVGFLTALGLARAGVPVMVVEAESCINDSPRASTYFATTLRILEDLGLMADVNAIAFWSRTFSYRVLATGEAVRVDTGRMLPPDAPYRENRIARTRILASTSLRKSSRVTCSAITTHRCAGARGSPN
jgi:2-polyprenyl-6-methoxyphenol hydroxylase-like FAD-dependent oxidoreductase